MNPLTRKKIYPNPNNIQNGISPRPERFLASKIGGFGVCGRPICCAKWLTNAPDLKVSINMAKAQHISLAPENLNGYCCHMKCCLAFEAPPLEPKHPKTDNPQKTDIP